MSLYLWRADGCPRCQVERRHDHDDEETIEDGTISQTKTFQSLYFEYGRYPVCKHHNQQQ